MAKAKTKDTPVTGGKYQRTRSVTLPQLKLTDETPVYVRFMQPMFVSKVIQKAKPGEAPKDPATVVMVTNIETGELMQLIVGAALKGILTEEYAGDAYVDKNFEIVKHEKAPGRRYNTYSVYEIEPS